MEELNYLKLKELLPSNVNLLVVSKGFKSSDIERIHNLGQNHFGESRVQEALDKKIFINNSGNIKWHFIGRIQTNKIRKIVQHFEFIHSCDSYRKLLKISEVALQMQKVPTIMMQIKLLNDPSKGGMFFEELKEKWDQIKEIKGIKVNGLMTINPKGLSLNENLKLFRKCRSLADSMNLPECSMGMSQDWKQAVEAGSTWIRIGSLIFGKRTI